jgi:hypothetical protein
MGHEAAHHAAHRVRIAIFGGIQGRRGVSDSQRRQGRQGRYGRARDRVMSWTYLWLPRTGQRDNPTMKHLIAIARFFGVPPTHFFPDNAMAQDAVPAERIH